VISRISERVSVREDLGNTSIVNLHFTHDKISKMNQIIIGKLVIP